LDIVRIQLWTDSNSFYQPIRPTSYWGTMIRDWWNERINNSPCSILEVVAESLPLLKIGVLSLSSRYSWGLLERSFQLNSEHLHHFIVWKYCFSVIYRETPSSYLSAIWLASLPWHSIFCLFLFLPSWLILCFTEFHICDTIRQWEALLV